MRIELLTLFTKETRIDDIETNTSTQKIYDKFDYKQVDLVLDHFNLYRMWSHCLENPKQHNMLEIIKFINSEIIFLIHLMNYNLYKIVTGGIFNIVQNKRRMGYPHVI